MLKIIFKLYKRQLTDLFIEDLIGEIPKSVNEPATDFLKTARVPLEKWLMYQSFQLQKRAMYSPKDAPTLNGCLLYIRVIMAIVTKEKIKKIEPESPVVEKNPLDGVKEFMSKSFNS